MIPDAASFFAGFALGAAAIVAVLIVAGAAVAAHGRKVDRCFNEQLNPVPSNVRVLDAQRRGMTVAP